MQSSLLANDEFVIEPGPNYDYNNSNNNTTSAAPSTTRTYPIVQVIAPETLAQGYTFDVEFNHEILSVVVPYGGVSKGQTFQTQTKPQIQDLRGTIRIPVGGWKDSLFDFCKYGPGHPSLVCAVFCPLVSLGQVYTRLGLDWHGGGGGEGGGDNGGGDGGIMDGNTTTTTTTTTGNQNTNTVNPNPYSSRAFKIMVAITVLFNIIINIIDPIKHGSWIHVYNITFLLLCCILIGRTRTTIRKRYDIQATLIQEALEKANVDIDLSEWGSGSGDGIMRVCGCDVVEDYCVSCFCLPCAVSQMNRHTAPYETYEGTCFSSNGLPVHAPVMV